MIFMFCYDFSASLFSLCLVQLWFVKLHTRDIVRVLIKLKIWIQENFKQNLRSVYASKDVCTSPMKHVLNCCHLQQLKDKHRFRTGCFPEWQVCSSLNYISRFGIQGAALLHKWKQFSWDISNLFQWKAREIYCIRSITVLTDSGMSFHQNAFLCPLLPLTPLSSPHPYPFKLLLFPGSSWFCNSAEGRSCCFTQMSPRFTLPAGLRDHSH